MQRRADAKLYRADEEDLIEDFSSEFSELKNEVISVESPIRRDQGSQTGDAQLQVKVISIDNQDENDK